jgi:FAD/FMN-containing dehydrogenase
MPVSNEVILKLKQLLGEGGYRDAPTDVQPYLTAWRGGWQGKAPLVALPASTQQLSELVKICAVAHVPMVPQSGNTGLVGGSVPSTSGDEILVSLSRMNKIRTLDPIGATVVAEAGAILQQLQEQADKHGFLFPISMASEGSAQIGGIISTNAGGTAVLRYGNTREQVLGLEVVMADGTIISNLNGLRKDNAGYNLAQYFIGAEGTLGFITAAALKLYPRLQQTVTAIVTIDQLSQALALLQQFRAHSAEHLVTFEVMAANCIEHVLKNIPNSRTPTQNPAPYYLLIELGSTNPNTDLRSDFEKLVGAALDNEIARDAVIAESEDHARAFWHLREHVPDALRKEGGDIHFDITLPIAVLAEFIEQTSQKVMAAQSGMIIAPFGHIGDGNLHYNMLLPKTLSPEQAKAAKTKIEEIVYSAVVQRGGSISAEHGIGIARQAHFYRYKDPAEIAVMYNIKRALDPHNLMNPGKIFLRDHEPKVKA